MLVAVDNCAVGARVTEEVAVRLKTKVDLKRERFAVCSTHTHCGPALNSELDFIFGTPIPADQKARIDRYTRELTDALEKVALAAAGGPIAGDPGVGSGTGVGFAANRRVLKDGRWVNFGVNPNGPVDHSLPVLRVTDPSGKVRAVLFGYACHCTTLGGEFNQICAEWAGYACDEIERQFPGATALAIIGCGADANPEPRRGLDDAKTARVDCRPRSRAAGQVGAHSPARPSSTPGFAGSSCRWNPLRTARPSNEKPSSSGSEGFLAKSLIAPPRSRRIARNAGPVLGRNLVLRRRSGHGLSSGRGRRRLRVAPQVGDRPEPALGRRLQQRRPVLHPIPADPERGRL